MKNANAKHTPGPWSVEDGFDRDGKGRYMPSVRLFKSDIPWGGKITIPTSHDQEADSIMANARLIAAAPELLEACRLIADTDKAGIDSEDRYEAIVKAQNAAQSAIAKAKGE